ELHAFERIGESEFERVLRDPDGAGRGLDAGALEGRHQLLEALPLDRAEQSLGRHRETVEGDFIFLHAAIAEYRDLGAAHPRRWKGFLFAAARLLGQEYAETAIAALIGIGAGEQRHQVGARAVRDPGFRAM